jgi:putative phosphoribosyl transferase
MKEQTGESVAITANGTLLEGVLRVPDDPEATVIVAHGRGRRLDLRDNFFANVLPQHSLATLLVDLLTPAEDGLYENRLNIKLLTERLASVQGWLRGESGVRHLPLGLLGIDTGAAAALRLTSSLDSGISAVVSVSGRPDLAKEFLARVTAPTRLIVGARDELVLGLNRQAYHKLQAERELVIIPGVANLFEQFDALEEAGDRSSEWFSRHLPAALHPRLVPKPID